MLQSVLGIRCLRVTIGRDVCWSASDAARQPGAPIDFARPIAVRRRHYGQFEFSNPTSAQPEAAIAQVLDIVVHFLAALAERERLVAANTGLAAQHKDVSAKLHTYKLVARATGIIAVHRETTREAALDWLRDQSRNARLPLGGVAERVIESYILSSRVTRSLRRTA